MPPFQIGVAAQQIGIQYIGMRNEQVQMLFKYRVSHKRRPIDKICNANIVYYFTFLMITDEQIIFFSILRFPFQKSFQFLSQQPPFLSKSNCQLFLRTNNYNQYNSNVSKNVSLIAKLTCFVGQTGKSLEITRLLHAKLIF